MAFILFHVGLIIVVVATTNSASSFKVPSIGDIPVATFEEYHNDAAPIIAAAFPQDVKQSTTNSQRESLNRRSLVTYSVGFRSYGDRLVAKASNFQKYNESTDVQINIQYPNLDPNIAAVVTYIDIQVDQGSNDGNAYIVEGGIGERNIKVTLEINNTTYYSFSANIYGF